MYNENFVSLIGRLGRDPEVLALGDGAEAKLAANFSVATNRRWKDGKGEIKRATEWHYVVAFGRTAKFVGEHLRSGRLVRVLGHLHTRSYHVDGRTHFRTEIIVEKLSPLDAVPVDREAEACELAEA